ncbi:MAG: hypothetical protein PVJ62_03790, partial [Deltaproteobacteria bacterium]
NTFMRTIISGRTVKPQSLTGRLLHEPKAEIKARLLTSLGFIQSEKKRRNKPGCFSAFRCFKIRD